MFLHNKAHITLLKILFDKFVIDFYINLTYKYSSIGICKHFVANFINMTQKKIKNNLADISLRISESRVLDKLQQQFEQGKKSVSIKHLHGASAAALTAALWQLNKKQFFLICSNNSSAEDWYHDLKLFLDDADIVFLTNQNKSMRFHTIPEQMESSNLLDGISAIQCNETSIIITTPAIFDVNFPKPDSVLDSKISIRKGQAIDFTDFVTNLCLDGFERKDYVTSSGDLSVRGGILDLYPIGWDNPLRIEFWGNEIESIREFDTISQRSYNDHSKVQFISRIFHEDNTDETCNVFSYLTKNCLIVLDSPDSFSEKIEENNLIQGYASLSFNKIGESDLQFHSFPQPQFENSIKNLAVELQRLAAYDADIYICADGKIHLERIKELVENSLSSNDIPFESEFLSMADPKRTLQKLIWCEQAVSNGFFLPDLKIACYSEHQIFNRLRIRQQDKPKSKSGISLKELKQLNIGDYIVHEDKGIGIFDGFQTVRLGGSYQDCVRIIYEDGDILYVHLNYIHKVQKYAANEGVEPKVNKLGSPDWLRKKARTKSKLKDIARDLIKLYAQRKQQQGFSFQSDTIWQKEFEASFIYEDTPDQERTTMEVKNDMLSPTPMDRLVCGDVGFGKTEIAIRAAFKAAQSGKQTVVLVPTTILAQQHYMTFRDRLSRYPVTIDSISRFKTKAEQKVILEKLKAGGIDIIIGTHRLLSKDIILNDLGLLIIDEEHRFGVGAKEKLRQLRASVDTLSLTATPIPRTLNFSLLGARDLSVIETPPRNRIPIQTEVVFNNDNSILQAVDREIKRGGQIFYVNDRIEDLDRLAMELKMKMPEITFAVAHGQIPSSQLESIMEKFVQGKFDVLVTTKIVESGLDIPNANTMIINNSQNFGLAELYQLRGRVGRTNIQAYCFLIIPPIKSLSQKSLQRLQAIEEFTDLGSGFQLAMRDLEIRGAGNLLGPEQSGFINEIGFEMYHKVLDEAVKELRQEEFKDLFHESVTLPLLTENDDIAIELNKDALLPADYIKSDTERFQYYKELYKLRKADELKAVIDELTDRFGKLPKPAMELVFAVKVRIAALGTGFTKISFKDKSFIAELPSKDNHDYFDKVFPVIREFLEEYPQTNFIENQNTTLLEFPYDNRDSAPEILWRLKKTINDLL
ncbi:MAG: transcription-repair coupling factor [Ignavibacteria bacterium]|nr:transcription-repair coupling factor [Ignavibacteria bacterium]